jgi:hypothetical protein
VHEFLCIFVVFLWDLGECYVQKAHTHTTYRQLSSWHVGTLTDGKKISDLLIADWQFRDSLSKKRVWNEPELMCVFHLCWQNLFQTLSCLTLYLWLMALWHGYKGLTITWTSISPLGETSTENSVFWMCLAFAGFQHNLHDGSWKRK